jgi:glycosyltransferase involved in cell wall biosynthesis
MQKNKIGLGVITCDRIDFLQKCLNSVQEHTKSLKDFELIVINDGFEGLESNGFNTINTTGKTGVGNAKNIALKHLIEHNCEHIFLMEDDVQILDSNVFDVYIKTSKITGVKHLNFALHGNHNKDLYGNFTIRRVINYPDDTKLCLYPNLLGAFSYYHIDVLNASGLMDEQFYNALEHVDHTYQIIKKGFHPPFRWFADVFESQNLLSDIVPDHQQSKIRSDEDFISNFFKNHEKFINKNNFSVINGQGPAENMHSEEEVVKNLQIIWKNHHDPEAINKK